VYSTPSQHRYWNARLDPLDWKRASDGSNRRRAWRQAYATFLTPETADAIELLAPLHGTRLLELGSGHGYGALHLARRGADVVALDLSDRRLAIAVDELRDARREAPDAAGVRPCAADAERLPFADGSFDRIFSRDVLMYADPRRVVAECARVLAPGGLAVFVESLDGNPLTRAFRRFTSPPDYRGFTRHLRFDEMLRVGRPLEPCGLRAYYLLSLIGFIGLFVLRSTTLHRWCLRVLHPLDRALLAGVPALRRFAWRATALYRKPDHADAPRP